MDVLSEVLRVVRLDSAIYFNAKFSEPWCLASPASRALVPIFARGEGHLIIYHFVCQGQAYIHLEDEPPVALGPGDVVSLPHGHAHWLGGGPTVPPVDVGMALPGVLAHGLGEMRMGGGGSETKLICGFLMCDPLLSQAFLGGLPPVMKVNIREDSSGRWLENSLSFSVAQGAAGEAGSTAMLAKLSEAVFAETLRRYVRQLPTDQTGWLAGARDADVGRALTLLHQKPAHPWTLVDLARETGVSRTVLSDRFRHFLGESPMAYLTRWRLGLGARALKTSTRSIADVAFEVGYESEAAFNRAFKREYGAPPAKYRASHREPS